MAESACPRCGRPVKWVAIADSGERIMLDTIPTVGGTFRLDGNNVGMAERIDRPGHQGYEAHDESCTALQR